MTLTPIRRRLQLSNVSDSSLNSSAGSGMEVEFASGICENLAPGMDSRESTRRSSQSTPTRCRSASSPFSSPAGMAHMGKVRSPAIVSPLLGTSPTQGLKRHGFIVVRKRRSTFNDRIAERKKRTSSPVRPLRTPVKKSGDKAGPADDYVLREDNLCSGLEDLPMDQDSPAAPFKNLVNNEIIIKRPRLKMSQRRSSYSRPDPDRGVNDSPISFRAKRCLSLRSPSNCDDRAAAEQDRKTDIRKRNRSVNDFNLPHEENIKTIDPLMDRADLVGDFSRQLSLPVTTCGRHSDLKYISTQTMVDLLQGKIPVDFFVVDARYPYEYNGGHIRGGKNLYTKEQVQNHFYGPNPYHLAQKENPNRKQIIIFHCEFSVERGPSMLRFLRKMDRSTNRYPALDYPEIYILKGGYKQFFADHREATTGTFVPMLENKYSKELRHFRRKCKTLPAGKLL